MYNKFQYQHNNLRITKSMIEISTEGIEKIEQRHVDLEMGITKQQKDETKYEIPEDSQISELDSKLKLTEHMLSEQKWLHEKQMKECIEQHQNDMIKLETILQ